MNIYLGYEDSVDIFGPPQNWSISRGNFYAFEGLFFRACYRMGIFFGGLLKFQIFFRGA